MKLKIGVMGSGEGSPLGDEPPQKLKEVKDGRTN